MVMYKYTKEDTSRIKFLPAEETQTRNNADSMEVGINLQRRECYSGELREIGTKVHDQSQ